MKQVAIALFVLVFVAGGCAGQGEEDTTTAVAGPALLMFYTDN
jgi:hypothetical protein